MPTRMLVLYLVVAGSVACSCSGGTKKSGPLVAKGQGLEITTAELQAKLDEQSPVLRARYTSRERKKEFLENMLRFELLVAEAKRQGLDRDPEVQATLQKMMVQRLVRKSFENGEAGAPTDEQVKKFYEERIDEYVRPERVRISQIFLRAERGSADRARRAGEARKLLARLKAEEAKSPLVFGTIARETSDDTASKPMGGDLGYRTRGDLEALLSKEAAAAAFALVQTGDESGVVESNRGFHILKLTGRQPAMNRTLDEVRAQISARLSRETSAKSFEVFVAKLRESAEVEIVDAELDKVRVTASPGSGEAATSASPTGSADK